MADIFSSLNRLEKLLNSALQDKLESRSALIRWAWQVHGDGGDVPDYVWRIILPDGFAAPPKSASEGE